MHKNYLHIRLCIALFILSSCDISQYKRIGNTNYYLSDGATSKYIFFLQSKKYGTFEPISHKGIIQEIRWNNKYIILKCSKTSKDCNISYWYIMNYFEDKMDWKNLDIKEFVRLSDYQKALKAMHISECHMSYTNGNIPWSLHLFD